MLRTIRGVASAFVVAVSLATPLFATAPVFTNNFTAVTLDGVRLGTDTDPSNYSMFPSVVYDPSSGLFHMWVANTSALTIEGLRHATSSDGVHFISDGNLSFAGGNPFPAYGANTEPQFEFPRAAKIGSDWKLLIWTENNPSGAYGDYNYNESVNDIGADPSTLAVTHQGPVFPTDGTGTFGQTTGPYGIVNGKLYVEDDRIGGLSKWEYNDATPPSVTPPADVYQDLITGTGYVYFLTNPGNPLGVYVHNVARVLDQGDGTLGVYYSLRYPDGSRVNKQIYYSESADGGQTWSAPAGLFSNGDAVRVNGAPNTFDFSHPEVALIGSRRVLYFSTKAADGAFVVATSAAQPPQANSWADILGSGQGAGETGQAVIRTSDGGYAIAGNSHGLTADPVGFWLLRLDATGEVLSQRVYAQNAPVTAGVSSLAESTDGGFVMAGAVFSTHLSMWVLKVDSLGNVAWSETISVNDPALGDDASCLSLVATSDGGFALAGLVADRFGLVKLAADGSLQWIRAYPGPAGSLGTQAFSLVETADGGLGATGSAWLSGLQDFRVLKTDSSGNISWEVTNAAPNLGFGYGIANSPSGGLVVTGEAPGIWAIALDQTGSLIWQKNYSLNSLNLIPSSIASASDGNYGIALSPNRFTTLRYGSVLEIDASGNPLWAKSFATQLSSLSLLSSIAATFDGGYVTVGQDQADTDTRLLAVKVDSGGGFVGCLDEEVSLPASATDASFNLAPLADTPVDEMANTVVTAVPVTGNPTDASERIICRGYLPSDLDPTALAADPSGNGVADPGESFVVAPTWENDGLVATFLTGHSSLVSDSNGLNTADPDPDASYGTVPSLATSDCLTATDDCFQFQFQNIPRPSQHWDTTFDETLSTSDPHHRWAKRWTVHAGLSFADVSPTSTFYPFVENIFHNGITGGCGAGVFCPTNPVTRAQMSVFLLKAKHGKSYVPPPCTPGVFADVPCPSLFADWIEELAAETITAGCGGGNFCPDDPVTRQQMAVFLLKALIGSGYTPPACAGIFGDVACPSQFANWVETLYNRHITAGCSTSPLLYCPTAPNVREQMAVFLTKTFSLLLYAP
jgi:S-layer homology domain